MLITDGGLTETAEGFNVVLKPDGDYIRAGMVKAFISSVDYRTRFGR